jgi:NADH:ubiquinone oxidoreductase subunit F (NADH-binding)
MTRAATSIAAPPPPAATERLLAGLSGDVPTTYRAHLDRFGPLPERAEVGGLLEDAGLRGRGGGAFPAATKLRSVAGARMPVVVVNGVEGEPASAKDKLLLRLAPHLVIDGAVAAARAVGAREVVVAVADDARAELAAVRSAFGQRGREPVVLRAVAVPRGFVSGEETALLHSLNGGDPKPTLKPPYPFERGLRRAPTLVHNVETAAYIALIARFGAEWFRSAGAPDAPGTALVTLSGAVRRPGVQEIELGSSLGDLIRRSGGLTEPVGAFLVGGYFGRWVAASNAAALRLVPERLGAGAIVAFPDSVCGLRECARVVRYLARESAGQCGPCVHGLDAIAGAVERLAAGEVRARAQLERWAEQVRGRGACRHPDGAVGFALSAVTVFAAEVDEHGRGRCRREDRPVLPVPRVRR